MVSKKKQLVTSRGIAGKDIMAKKEKELAPDFHKRIIQGRKKKGWDQRTFALKMNERLNIVQKIEKGGRPTDKLIQKIEKIGSAKVNSTIFQKLNNLKKIEDDISNKTIYNIIYSILYT